MKHTLLKISFTFFAAACLLLCGCVNVSPSLHPDITPVPSAAPTPAVSPTAEIEVSPSITPTAVPSDTSALDALGNFIYDAEHFQQYLQFRNIRVYENGGDTFLDCTVVNDYPETICCAVNICFYDENGEVIANGNLQVPDGSYMLSLPPGETPLYAAILTDISLLDKEFELIFDQDVEVKPLIGN